VSRRSWIVPLAITAAGAAIFGLSVAHGDGLALVWLPAVLLAAAWPRPTSQTARNCLHRLGAKGRAVIRRVT